MKSVLGSVLFAAAVSLLLEIGVQAKFSSNIVMLNSRNWRKEVEESPHAVFVNVW